MSASPAAEAPLGALDHRAPKRRRLRARLAWRPRPTLVRLVLLGLPIAGALAWLWGLEGVGSALQFAWLASMIGLVLVAVFLGAASLMFTPPVPARTQWVGIPLLAGGADALTVAPPIALLWHGEVGAAMLVTALLLGLPGLPKRVRSRRVESVVACGAFAVLGRPRYRFLTTCPRVTIC